MSGMKVIFMLIQSATACPRFSAGAEPGDPDHAQGGAVEFTEAGTLPHHLVPHLPLFVNEDTDGSGSANLTFFEDHGILPLKCTVYFYVPAVQKLGSHRMHHDACRVGPLLRHLGVPGLWPSWGRVNACVRRQDDHADRKQDEVLHLGVSSLRGTEFHLPMVSPVKTATQPTDFDSAPGSVLAIRKPRRHDASRRRQWLSVPRRASAADPFPSTSVATMTRRTTPAHNPTPENLDAVRAIARRIAEA